MFNTSSKPVRVIDPSEFASENWHPLFKAHPALQWVIKAEQLPADPQEAQQLILEAQAAIGRLATGVLSYDPVIPKPQVDAIRQYIQAAAGPASSKL